MNSHTLLDKLKQKSEFLEVDTKEIKEIFLDTETLDNFVKIYQENCYVFSLKFSKRKFPIFKISTAAILNDILNIIIPIICDGSLLSKKKEELRRNPLKKEALKEKMLILIMREF